tara:strand:+ start:596 stop:1282 length:687 start_codon:yes stop_codon:yes gene_type:complete
MDIDFLIIAIIYLAVILIVHYYLINNNSQKKTVKTILSKPMRYYEVDSSIDNIDINIDDVNIDRDIEINNRDIENKVVHEEDVRNDLKNMIGEYKYTTDSESETSSYKDLSNKTSLNKDLSNNTSLNKHLSSKTCKNDLIIDPNEIKTNKVKEDLIKYLDFESKNKNKKIENIDAQSNSLNSYFTEKNEKYKFEEVPTDMNKELPKSGLFKKEILAFDDFADHPYATC